MLQLADFLFVRRNWLRDQRRIQNTFSNIKRLQTPVWITSFVEGTRFSPIKLREVGLFNSSIKERDADRTIICSVKHLKRNVDLQSCVTCFYHAPRALLHASMHFDFLM